MTFDDGAIERLVGAAQQGDPEAFGALFDHFYGPLAGRRPALRDPGRAGEPEPAAGAMARVDAQLQRAQERLAEAVEAREAVRSYHQVLLGIAAWAPAGAANGLDRAIANSDRVIEALATPGPGTGAGDNGNEPGNGAGNGNPGAQPTDTPVQPTAKPQKTPAPTATAKPPKGPAATPKPGKTPGAAATPKPGRTPPPHKTPDPGKPDGTRRPGPTARP